MTTRHEAVPARCALTVSPNVFIRAVDATALCHEVISGGISIAWLHATLDDVTAVAGRIELTSGNVISWADAATVDPAEVGRMHTFDSL